MMSPVVGRVKVIRKEESNVVISISYEFRRRGYTLPMTLKSEMSAQRQIDGERKRNKWRRKATKWRRNRDG
jgi:hypothetical protein